MNLKYQGRFGDGLIYQRGPCKIILSGPEERSQIGWHFSIACPDRNPTWEEQRDTRYDLIPDGVYMVQILPPKSEYVNLHPFTFHWWESGPKYFDPATGSPRPEPRALILRRATDLPRRPELIPHPSKCRQPLILISVDRL